MLAVHLESGRVEVQRKAVAARATHGVCADPASLRGDLLHGSRTPARRRTTHVFQALPDMSLSARSRRPRTEAGSARGSRARSIWRAATCDWCARDLGRHCPHRTVLGIVKHPGAFREFLTLPVENLHPVPAAISDEQAVFIEPVAAACEILDQVRLKVETRVAVLGDGKLGLLIAQVLAAHGAQVHLLGRHKDKDEIGGKGAREVTAGVIKKAIGKNLPVARIPDGGGCLRLRRRFARGDRDVPAERHGDHEVHSARISEAGHSPGDCQRDHTRSGRDVGALKPAIKLLASGKVRVDGMISERFPLDRAPEAFARAASKGVLKVLLGPAGGNAR